MMPWPRGEGECFLLTGDLVLGGLECFSASALSVLALLRVSCLGMLVISVPGRVVEEGIFRSLSAFPLF